MNMRRTSLLNMALFRMLGGGASRRDAGVPRAPLRGSKNRSAMTPTSDRARDGHIPWRSIRPSYKINADLGPKLMPESAVWGTDPRVNTETLDHEKAASHAREAPKRMKGHSEMEAPK